MDPRTATKEELRDFADYYKIDLGDKTQACVLKQVDCLIGSSVKLVGSARLLKYI